MSLASQETRLNSAMAAQKAEISLVLTTRCGCQAARLLSCEHKGAGEKGETYSQPRNVIADQTAVDGLQPGEDWLQQGLGCLGHEFRKGLPAEVECGNPERGGDRDPGADRIRRRRRRVKGVRLKGCKI